MNPRNLLVAVAAVLVLGAAFTLRSQGLTDGIKVTLPEPVTVGDVVLEPGEYEIRRASTNQDQVLRIFSNDKLRYQDQRFNSTGSRQGNAGRKQE